MDQTNRDEFHISYKAAYKDAEDVSLYGSVTSKLLVNLPSTLGEILRNKNGKVIIPSIDLTLKTTPSITRLFFSVGKSIGINLFP